MIACLRIIAFAVCVAICTLPGADSTAQVHSDAEEFFETEVRPLLADRCWECHAAGKREGDLRLDSGDSVRRGGYSGPALVPGSPEQSLLFQAVTRSGDLEMPPDEPLTAPQIEVLRRWIEMGAPWPESRHPAPIDSDAWKNHWAFQRVQDCQPPQVDDQGWSRNPIDQFVWHKLAQYGLHPTSEADRRTLIRRASYTLTGLPPSYQEVESFANDPRSDAYERLIDRLLESPRYGEHLARSWLDVARYSDTKGYVYGREERFFVHAPLYRDWVIAAFNRDLPYDQFIKLQIAADQVAPEDPQSLAAMGLLTLGRRFLGVTHDIIDDRIDVVGRGTMGLTIACARCHDHKYDPIPTSDYYSLYGVFQCSAERQVDLTSYKSAADSDPQFQAELKSRQEKLHEKMEASRMEASHRSRQRLAEYLVAQSELRKYPEEGFDQILAATDIIPAFVRRWENYLATRDPQNDLIFGPWLRLASLEPENFHQQSLSCIREIASDRAVHPWVAKLFESVPNDLRDVAQRYGELFSRVDEQWKLLQTAEGTDTLSEVVSRAWLTLAQPLLDVLHGPQAPCEVPDEEIVSIETFFDTSTCEQLWKLQGEVDRWRLSANQTPAVAVALFDRATLVEPRIFRRGNPANKGPRVQRHFLSLFSEQPPEPFPRGSGRLELAERIVDSSNPLTPRVWVNRLWQHHFGRGLVSTPSDFGIRAEPPSHPELLDWLAMRLMEGGWSTKAIHRLILLSSTFRQADRAVVAVTDSDAMADLDRARQIDPENRLLWQMSSRRLRFEELRDSLLSVSGSIQHSISGKPEDMFSSDDSNRRRTVYGMIDRQFLPGTLRVFDFANPNLHIGRRSETQVPQQSLYFLNHPFVAQRARSLVAHLNEEHAQDESPQSEFDLISRMYHAVLQRNPTKAEIALATDYLKHDDTEMPPVQSAESLAWNYGFGEVDDEAAQLENFHPLPHFTGSAWQGGVAFPDDQLGWVQITAEGGHPGNDLQHACVRRWIAPINGKIAIQSLAKHQPETSDGARFRIFSSRHGLLRSINLKAGETALDVSSLDVRVGDTIDFVVDILRELNSDQFLWTPIIEQLAESDEPPSSAVASPAKLELKTWDAQRDFHGPPPQTLSRAEQLAQVLLLTNEFSFVD